MTCSTEAARGPRLPGCCVCCCRSARPRKWPPERGIAGSGTEPRKTVWVRSRRGTGGNGDGERWISRLFQRNSSRRPQWAVKCQRRNMHRNHILSVRHPHLCRSWTNSSLTAPWCQPVLIYQQFSCSQKPDQNKRRKDSKLSANRHFKQSGAILFLKSSLKLQCEAGN